MKPNTLRLLLFVPLLAEITREFPELPYLFEQAQAGNAFARNSLLVKLRNANRGDLADRVNWLLSRQE